jgi:uncharacterized protein YbjT (DUF2867 family)
MSHVVIAGASGVVGSRVLQELLAHPDVQRVAAIGRRPLPVVHERLLSLTANLQETQDIAGRIPDDTTTAFCCLGTTLATAGSREAFQAVDRDAVVAFATAARERRVGHFLLVSSLGAHRPRNNFYLQTKAAAEAAVAQLGFARLTILRPSFIDDHGTRPDYRRGERVLLPLARLIFRVVGPTHRYAPISADVIARAMVRLAFDSGGERVRIVESDALHTLGASGPMLTGNPA